MDSLRVRARSNLSTAARLGRVCSAGLLTVHLLTLLRFSSPLKLARTSRFAEEKPQMPTRWQLELVLDAAIMGLGLHAARACGQVASSPSRQVPDSRSFAQELDGLAFGRVSLSGIVFVRG